MVNSLNHLKLICTYFILFSSPTVRAEAAIVWSEQVDLYRDTRLVQVLRFGEVVLVKKDKTDPEWIRVKFDGVIYSARKRSFRSRRGIENDFTREKTSLENEEQSLIHSIDANIARNNHLFSCILQVEWDRTIFFRIPIVEPLVTGGSSSKHPLMNGLQGKTQSSCPPQYKRIEKISLFEARRLKKKVG